jgi:hypothetical protein
MANRSLESKLRGAVRFLDRGIKDKAPSTQIFNGRKTDGSKEGIQEEIVNRSKKTGMQTCLCSLCDPGWCHFNGGVLCF